MFEKDNNPYLFFDPEAAPALRPWHGATVMQRRAVVVPDLPTFTPTKDQVEALAEQIGSEESAAMPGFTNDQVQKMQDYAAALRRKYPNMKAERLGRKVREYFKLSFK